MANMLKKIFRGKFTEKQRKYTKDKASDETISDKLDPETEQTNALVVVAIDFGTTFSGWAYSYRHEYERDPIKISAKTWHGGRSLSQKGPTCLLINPDGKTINSFGFEAENRYAEKVDNGEHDQWFYFRRFKMKLFKDNGMTRQTTLEDESGKSLPAMTVFSLSIEYLKTDVLETLGQQVGKLEDDDIQWILTVPAIWNDAAKQFMREAAQKAGIPPNKLMICLEPEAASIFCRHLPVSKSLLEGDRKSLGQLDSGTKYIVLDAGGGTVDITVHEVTENGDLRELHRASGGDWGGTKVDEAYEAFLRSIVGDDVMKQFKNNNTDDYIDMFRDFEIKKRTISLSTPNQITVRMPVTLSTNCTEMKGSELKDLILKSQFESKLVFKADKMRIDSDLVREFFRPTVQSIICHVTTLLLEPSVLGCSAMLMVGGFSDSPMLQQTVQEQFPKLRIIIPNDASLAVLKGAVIFGHEPRSIIERVCKYTYGTATTHLYSEQCTHPRGTVKKDENGDMRCYNIFRVHTQAGQSVKIDQEQQELLSSPITDDQTDICVRIYSSPSTCPNFTTDEGCRQIGTIRIHISDTSFGRHHKFGTSFIFGGTEIVVKVVDKETGDVTVKSVDFLG